jgi:hypothetical protein
MTWVWGGEGGGFGRDDEGFGGGLGPRAGLCGEIAGDLDTAKSVLREYIKGTHGFVALGDALSKSPKSLMRMLSPDGNPQARNLFDMVAYLQQVEGTILKVSATAA